jgi:hypothetical protein
LESTGDNSRPVIWKNLVSLQAEAGVKKLNRLDAVHDQIQDDLLQLHPVADDGFQAVQQAGFERDIASTQLAMHQDEDFPNRLVDVHLCHLG